MMASYNPRVTISSPFPEADLPKLFSWIEKSSHQIACDQSPHTLDDFMEYQLLRIPRMITWGVYNEGELCGYLALIPRGEGIGEGHCIFKRDAWGHEITLAAINLALLYSFTAGIEIMLFRPFESNRAVVPLHKSLGAKSLGLEGDAGLTRDGEPVQIECWGLLKNEWVKANAQFIAEHAAAVGSAEGTVEEHKTATQGESYGS